MCPILSEIKGDSFWEQYRPEQHAPWNLQRVVHLHRRAGFAASWEQLQRDLKEEPQQAIDRILSKQVQDANSSDFETIAKTIGDAAMASGNPGRLKAWWMYRMLLTSDPLSERLTLMWHNHFATSNRKVQDLVLMRQQNDLFRSHAQKPFAELLQAAVKHPAMLLWLDADSNRKGHPNENLARELMELFTLGIGNYDELDVKEAARTITGWSVINSKFSVRENRHDKSEKSLLGHRGNYGGDDLLALLLENSATSQRLAWRICDAFMGEGVVSQLAINELAAGLQSRNLDLQWAIGTVLRSQLFFSNENLQSRISSPVDFVIGTLRALEIVAPPPSTLLLAEWATRMGQDLFYPPNVGGWKTGRAWLNSRSIIARVNFANALVNGQLWNPSKQVDFNRLLNRHGVDASLRDTVAWFAELLTGAANPEQVDLAVNAAREANSGIELNAALMHLLTCSEAHLI